MLEEIAANYFKTLNPLAERISGDIENIKNAYNVVWDKLTLEEQEQIIDETIIHPDILIKYSQTLKDIYGNSRCKIITGSKIITDESSGHNWLDEHSAPFSWKSRSLLEICTSTRCVPGVPINIISIEPTTITQESEKRDLHDTDETDGNANGIGAFSTFCARLKSLPGKSYEYGCQFTHSIEDKGLLSKFKKDAVVKLQSTFKIMSGRVSGPCGGENDALVIKGGATIVPRSEKTSLAKPSTPPPPPPRVLLKRDAEIPLLENESKCFSDQHEIADTLSSINDELSPACASSDASVPKTGFDFLDNW